MGDWGLPGTFTLVRLELSALPAGATRRPTIGSDKRRMMWNMVQSPLLIRFAARVRHTGVVGGVRGAAAHMLPAIRSARPSRCQQVVRRRGAATAGAARRGGAVVLYASSRSLFDYYIEFAMTE